jgi:hypothetical protein
MTLDCNAPYYQKSLGTAYGVRGRERETVHRMDCGKLVSPTTTAVCGPSDVFSIQRAKQS